ncbi:hypothetical protein OPT61_g10230 [Boeremia exigua]|uniref:Uncharacterized protein n=1 Tax=Boeremia exigua TaxID=749465 RepID=A0ACC2HQR9_9PLEO|nr:hypothetical protein OPT61_g10230 [Boeremia exigua]
MPQQLHHGPVALTPKTNRASTTEDVTRGHLTRDQKDSHPKPSPQRYCAFDTPGAVRKHVVKQLDALSQDREQCHSLFVWPRLPDVAFNRVRNLGNEKIAITHEDTTYDTNEKIAHKSEITTREEIDRMSATNEKIARKSEDTAHDADENIARMNEEDTAHDRILHTKTNGASTDASGHTMDAKDDNSTLAQRPPPAHDSRARLSTSPIPNDQGLLNGGETQLSNLFSSTRHLNNELRHPLASPDSCSTTQQSSPCLEKMVCQMMCGMLDEAGGGIWGAVYNHPYQTPLRCYFAMDVPSHPRPVPSLAAFFARSAVS